MSGDAILDGTRRDVCRGGLDECCGGWVSGGLGE